MNEARAPRVLAPLVLGMFARALQLTVIGPSLLNIAQSLHATLVDVGWVMALYAAGSLIAQPIAGTLSDVRGRRLAFRGAIAIFATGSLVCALSTSLAALIAGRIVQSLGAGAIQPAAAAIVGDYVPPERQGAALGAIYGAFAAAAVVGSVIGGVLVDGGRAIALPYPWHLVFWINIPLALAALALATRLPADRPQMQAMAFDAPGALLIVVIAACLMFAAAWGPIWAALWLAACAATIAVLVMRERKARRPLLDLRLFAHREVALTFAVALASGIPIFSVTMYGAAYYMEAFHASAAQAGVAMLTVGIPLGAGLSVGGPLINRFGPKAALMAGAVCLAAGDLFLAIARPVPEVIASLAVCGLAMGLVSAPPNVLIYRYVAPELRGAGLGIMTMFASSGAVTAPAVVTAFLHYGGADSTAAFRTEFAVAFSLAVVCVALVAMLPRAPEASRGAAANPV